MAVTYKPNRAGFNALLNNANTVAMIEAKAEEAMAVAEANTTTHRDRGTPFHINVVHNTSRAVAFVTTSNIDGILGEVYHRALSKGLAQVSE